MNLVQDQIGVTVETPAGAVATLTRGFDYDALEPATTSEVRQITDRIRRRSADFYIQTGRDLIKVQELLGHGHFGRWLSAEFSWTDRTARNFMGAARLVEGKSEIISVLPATVIYKLSSPSTPDSVRDAILARVDSGETVTTKDVSKAIAQDKSERAAELAALKEQRRLASLTTAGRRQHEKTKAARAERQRQRELERDEAEQKVRAMEAAAIEAVALLVERLGPDWAKFVKLHEAAGYEFSTKVRERGGRR